MMNRNQKIALGCGGGGCLGLILLVIVVIVLIFAGIIAAPGIYSPNRNSNYNYNSNSNSNFNSDTNTNDNLNSNSDSSSSSMSEDDKHKLFQAAGLTKDSALMQRVMRKLGFITASGTASTDYEEFMKGHFAWAMKNVAFIQSVNTPEKAKAYVDEHFND